MISSPNARCALGWWVLVRLPNSSSTVLTTHRPSDVKEKKSALQSHSPNSFSKLNQVILGAQSFYLKYNLNLYLDQYHCALLFITF